MSPLGWPPECEPWTSEKWAQSHAVSCRPCGRGAWSRRRRTATRRPRREPRPGAGSPGDAGVTEAEPAGLRPHAQSVWLEADGDPSDQMTVLRRQRIDLAAVSAGQPQHLAIG